MFAQRTKAFLLEEEPSARPSDRVFDLLMTQKADGRFERSAVLDAWLGARTSKLTNAISKYGEAIVTALVIALFDREARDRESEWRPAVSKAERWLARQGTKLDASAVEQVIA